MLQALVPVAPVDRAIIPVHLSVADLDVVIVVTFVLAPRLPGEFTIAILFIILVSALILVTILITALFPVALPIFLAIEELTRINVAVAPHVLTEAFSLTVLVLTNIRVTDHKVVATLTVPQALLPLPFILVAVAPNVLAKAVWSVGYPLAYEAVTFDALPEAVSLLNTLDPLTVVHFAVGPDVLALAVDFAIVILTLIDIAIAEALVAETMSFVIGPLAFVYSLR